MWSGPLTTGQRRERRAGDDAIRSLVISYKLLGTQEWYGIHHSNCGMEFFTDHTKRSLLASSLETAVLGADGFEDVGKGSGSKAGAAQPSPHTLGCPRKGQLWESITVPELRLQARDLAQRLLASLPRHLQELSPFEAVPARAPVTPSLLLRQLVDADTNACTHLIAADAKSGDAALVDPELMQLGRDLSLLQELSLRLRFCLESRLHTSHITGAGLLRRRTGCLLLVPAAPGIRNADRLLTVGERLELGSLSIEVIAAPGHTPEQMADRLGDSHLFSGDALLIRGCGRTDVADGDAGQLNDSLQRLLALPETKLVLPSHDDSGRSHSSIGEERRHNPKLAVRTRADFIQLMNQESLAPRKRLREAPPANRHLGDLQPSDPYDRSGASWRSPGARLRPPRRRTGRSTTRSWACSSDPDPTAAKSGPWW
jgi:glyoxylase-like metal-dependent hydrolase (beta-lactamase superfamily II)